MCIVSFVELQNRLCCRASASCSNIGATPFARPKLVLLALLYLYLRRFTIQDTVTTLETHSMPNVATRVLFYGVL